MEEPFPQTLRTKTLFTPFTADMLHIPNLFGELISFLFPELLALFLEDHVL